MSQNGGASKEKLDYFIERTDKRLASIEYALYDLNRFKWKVYSVTAVIAILFSLGLELISVYIKS